ncbi:hypothetical protein JCM10213_007382 [Rhodosporidiobolus nylandii]
MHERPSPTPTLAPEVAEKTAGEKAKATKRTGVFSEPGTLPLPDHGYHHLGVAFEDVNVYGSGGERKTVEGLERAILQMWNVPSFVARLLNIKMGKKRPLISNVSGVVPSGEMLLVLGRPGAGCSTLLRAISNQRDSFAAVEGDVQYGRLTAKQAQAFSGEIVFNQEDDIHQPLLLVEQTIGSALSLKKPHAEPVKRADYAKDLTSRLLNAFGMPHTSRTKVGSAYVRGVSGGERKRVSLAEHLATNAAVSAWDLPIRGLDASVALHYVKIMKELSLSTGMTNAIALYQTSEDMYGLFDRVAVLYEGELAFFGLASDAQEFFEGMGWEKNPRQTTPDFLTSCTSVTERKVRPGHNGVVPQTPQEFAAYFRQSPYYAKLQGDITAYKAYHASSDDTERFIESVRASKQPLTGKNNGYKVNFARQTWELVKLQFTLQLADPTNIVVRLVANAINALIVGSVCYKPPNNANGSFAIAGALFFGILYFVIFAFGEIPPTVLGRPLLIKQRTLGMYNPAANVIAQMVSDVPLYALQVMLFSALFYFLVGLTAKASTFFTFFFVCFTNYTALSACYRAIGSWSPNLSVAVRYGGWTLAFVLSTAGFLLPPPLQLGWAGWMRRIAPPAFALESLLANEFRERTLTCRGAELIPSGPGYNNIAYQGCSIVGGTPGSANVEGTAYLAAKYGFYPSHIWRNVGIIWAMFAIYTFLVIVGSSLLIRDTGSASAKVFKSGAKIPEKKLTKVESRKQAEQAERVMSRHDEALGSGNQSCFTFKDVKYTVQVDGQDRLLLDNICAVIEPGKLVALMGGSGAGKTTLLETVSQRKTSGKVEGEFLVDGKPLDPEFSRRCAFAMQADVHEALATVRECIQFSALLRQDASVSREEKLRYAEEVIELLELQEIADAVVGNPEIGGLGVEEKKRLTIAVELAAKPDFLLFLDEPTSGLDSQAAYEICRFLKKIAASGLSVCASIHQPAGELFEMFDSVVLLAAGGKTVYAGPTADAPDYFASHGTVMPAEGNPAEFIIDTVSALNGKKEDWPARWRESHQAQEIRNRIDEINARGGSCAAPETTAKPKRFAASYVEQTKELTKRGFRAQWRNGSYHLTKLSSSVFFGLFIGFYFFHLTPSLTGIQSISLALLTLAQVVPPLALDTAVYYMMQFDNYLARERNGIYSWQALVTSLLIIELPVAIVAFCLMWFCSWWTIGLGGQSASITALGWLTFMAMAYFLCTFGVLLGSVSPTPGSIPYILSTLWVLWNITSWTLVPETVESSPYRYFASYLSPLKWLYGSLIGNAIGKLDVTCHPSELTLFNIPAGQTCASYLAAFMQAAPGYLATNGAATGSCEWCPMSSGADYLGQIGYEFAHRWRDAGVFVCFATVNIATCFGATWLLRIRPLYK